MGNEGSRGARDGTFSDSYSDVCSLMVQRLNEGEGLSSEWAGTKTINCDITSRTALDHQPLRGYDQLSRGEHPQSLGMRLATGED